MKIFDLDGELMHSREGDSTGDLLKSLKSIVDRYGCILKANLRAIDLSGEDLQSLHFDSCDLTKANFDGANLNGVSLEDCTLRDASFMGADLRGANLENAIVKCAWFERAMVGNSTQWPSAPEMLLACWATVSDELCQELMRYDAANHPHPELFNEWAGVSSCPYYSVNIQRAADFSERAHLWSPELLQRPAKSAYELMMMFLEEKTRKE